MDSRTRQVIAELTQHIARLEERLDRAERAARTPQLPNASLTNAAIKMVDADGTDRGSIGYQPDGTVAIVPVNGPPPPKPSTPAVAAGQLSLAVAWDGLFAEGDDGDPATQPLDFDHVQVHLSTTAGYTPDDTTLQGSLAKPGSVVITPLSDESTYYAVLVPVNTSGIAGEPSDATPGTPDAVVSGEVLDGSITTLKLADDAVTNAKIADNAVNANKLADGSVDAAAIIAGAVGSDAISASAIIAGKIAAGAVGATELAANSIVAGKIAAGVVDATALAAQAVTTAKLNALAVTSDKIAANAITAGKINAGAVTAGSIAAGAVTASTLESTLVMATEMQSTNYVAGTSGWHIDGSGSAEFNDADFRGDVLIGPSGSPQVHIYSASGAGRIDALSNNAVELDPARIVSGAFGSGTSTVIQTNFYGAKTGSTGNRPVLVITSENASGSAEANLALGTVDSSGGFHPSLYVFASGVVFEKQQAGFMTMTTSPTAAGDATWHTFSSGSWSNLFPYNRVCPPTESMAFDLYMRANNRATANATIGMSVQIKVGSTVLWQPANSDTDSCVFDQNDGTNAIAASNYRRQYKTIVIGQDILNGRKGQTLTITPMYRVSSGTSYTYAAAGMTIRDLPEKHASNVFS